MKFQATVVFEFNASDVGEAGKRLNNLLEHAREHDLETRSLELSTPSGTPVTLPPIASSGPTSPPHPAHTQAPRSTAHAR